MNAIDPTVKQRLLNHFSTDHAYVEPFILKDFENEHYDAPSIFAMVVAVAHSLILLKEGMDGLNYLKESADSIQWLVEKIRKMARTNSEKSNQDLDERERVLASLAKHQVSTGQGLPAIAISNATLLSPETVDAMLEQLATRQIVVQINGAWLVRVEDLSD